MTTGRTPTEATSLVFCTTGLEQDDGGHAADDDD